jgi:hypothetical protein
MKVVERLKYRARNLLGMLPDYRHGTLQPEEFHDLILRHGAVMLRSAVDPNLLDQIKQEIDGIFAQYSNALVPDDLKQHPYE